MQVRHTGAFLSKDPKTRTPALVAQKSRQTNGVPGAEKCRHSVVKNCKHTVKCDLALKFPAHWQIFTITLALRHAKEVYLTASYLFIWGVEDFVTLVTPSLKIKPLYNPNVWPAQFLLNCIWHLQGGYLQRLRITFSTPNGSCQHLLNVGSKTRQHLCSQFIFLPFGSAGPELCQRGQGCPWRLLKAKSCCCLHCLWSADGELLHNPSTREYIHYNLSLLSSAQSIKP